MKQYIVDRLDALYCVAVLGGTIALMAIALHPLTQPLA